MLRTIIRERWLSARAVVGLFPANSVDDDDVAIYADAARSVERLRVHFLRQQKDLPSGKPHGSLADFIAPAGAAPDYLGALRSRPASASKAQLARFAQQHDDYSAIMLKVAGRSARRGPGRAAPRACAPRVLGLRAGRAARNEQLDPRGVSRHPTGTRLSGQS